MVLSDAILVLWCKIQKVFFQPICYMNSQQSWALEIIFSMETPELLSGADWCRMVQNGAGNLLFQVEQHVIVLLNLFFFNLFIVL